MSDTVRNNLTQYPKAWPFEEAAKVVRRLEASGRQQALFETGYGPSGLPHIGTFGAVSYTHLDVYKRQSLRRHGRA